MNKRVFAILLSLNLAASLGAQSAPGGAAVRAKEKPKDRFELTVDNIMRGPGLVGWEPQAVRWSGDSERIYFQWKQYTDSITAPADTYTVNRDGSGLRKLSEEEVKSAAPPPPRTGHTSEDRTKIAFADGGDIYVYDLKESRRIRLTRTGDAESNPRFLRDSKRVSFVRNNNLFIVALDSPLVEQVTDIRPAGSPPPEPKKGTESQEFLKKEERELLETVRERAKRREELEARQKRENPRKPFVLQPRQQVLNLQLSGDEKHILATFNDPAATDAKTAIVPAFVTESAYTEDLQARNKVGDLQARSRPAILNTATGELKWIEFEEDKKERPVQLGPASAWSHDGARLAMIARSADNKNRWVVTVDLETAKARAVSSDEDKAWIGGPGAFTLGWLPNNEEIYFASEQTGFSHLYTVAAGGGVPAKALTSGNWEVLRASLSEDKRAFYLVTNEGSPHEQHVYSMALDGSGRTRLTSAPGAHDATVSPNGKWLADVHSYVNRPPELFVQENAAGASSRKLTDSPAPEFATYNWLDVPIVQFTARDGVKVPARFYKPANFQKGGPAVIFVHGAGYLQNVHRWWSDYYREYMFHHLLMERGYAVLDIDYRGSAGYGRNWRTAIYRYMGGQDLDDQVDGAQWLIAAHGVGPKRIGIYGGSYGGFITLMAMFTHPGTFAAGAALRPVTDWAHYNHPYTSNILNTPQKDTEAYKKSSPIYHAAGLKGALLICHGMVDVNVHFQDSVRLAQRLIELRKENWELAAYPVEDHGFVQPSSWADEYKRILKLFETNLK